MGIVGGIGSFVAKHRLVERLAELLGILAGAGYPHDEKFLGKELPLEEFKQGGYEFAVREVARGTEDDQYLAVGYLVHKASIFMGRIDR